MAAKPESIQDIVRMAARPIGLFVPRYSWAMAPRRKKARRACRDGLIVLISQDKNGFNYGVPSK